MWKELAAFRFYMEKVHIQKSIKYDEIFSALIKAMTEFSKKHQYSHFPADFIQSNLGKLAQLHDTIYGEFGSLYLDVKEKTRLRSPYDKIFRSALQIKDFNGYMSGQPTIIFTEFIKGITFFENEKEDERPIYTSSRLIWNTLECSSSNR
jgi:hypothetical protein